MPKKIKIFCPALEKEALKQFNDCCSKNFVIQAALMPDAHSGYVAPIGAVIKTKRAVVPSWVGYDIGCGMIAVLISDKKDKQMLIQENARLLFNQVNRDIPMGVGRYVKRNKSNFMVNELKRELQKLRELTTLGKLWETVRDKANPNLGTLGSGNHFIEILTCDDETWLVIHSGSRGVGHYLATYFMKAVSGRHKGYEATYAIENLRQRDEYMLYQKFCLEFALLNRLSMAMKVEKAIKAITGIQYDTMKNLWTNKNHNHCIALGNDLYLHRKGATSSDKGERGVIPGNMRDGCYLVEGLGNDDFLCSSSHGAGRQMSRTQARKNVKLEKFQKVMEGIVAPICRRTIDESPFAYKDVSEVMKLQKDSVKIIKRLKPIINWKGF